MRGTSRRISNDFALQNVDLTVKENEVVGFVGPNGAGKTTIIRAALGLVRLDSGDLNLFGHPLALMQMRLCNASFVLVLVWSWTHARFQAIIRCARRQQAYLRRIRTGIGSGLRPYVLRTD